MYFFKDSSLQKPTGEERVVGGRRKVVLPQNPTLTYNEQGTEAYIRSIIEGLLSKKTTLTSNQEDLLNQLNDAIDDQKVKSHILRQPFDDATGNLKEARLSTIF